VKEKLIQVANLMNNYVLSFVADELQAKNALNAGVITFCGYPYDYDYDKQFKYGLAIILNGVESMCK